LRKDVEEEETPSGLDGRERGKMRESIEIRADKGDEGAEDAGEGDEERE
jgi:hypothetical protein